MSVALYMDVHVHGDITAGLRRRGVDVLTAQEDGERRTKDPILLNRAATLGRVLVTHDRDFLAEAARRQQKGEFFAGVIYEHLLDIRVGQCVHDLDLIAKVYDLPEMANQVLYIPL